MDGSYLNNEKEYEKFLTHWKSKIIQGKLWEKFEDLHINEISTEFNNKENWIDGSIYIFNIASKIIDSSTYNLLLAIPLSYSSIKTELDRLTLNYLKQALDLTPPSFYLFPIENENYKKTINSSIFLEDLSKELGLTVTYKEVLEDENEYFRIIYIRA